MKDIQRLPSPIRFGKFEVDLQTGELRRQGFKVKLQQQPFQILLMLLVRPGEVVTRDELQKELWPADTFVDFERGLNRAINKLREALLDDADNPRFIETLPRRGYRFLVPVESGSRSQITLVPLELPRQMPETTPDDTAPDLLPSDVPVPDVATPQRRVLPWVLAAALALIAGIAVWRPWRGPAFVADRSFIQLDLDAGPDAVTEPAISPDGMRIVFVTKDGLAIRRLDQAKVTRLAGTAGAHSPFLSPNGQWVGFFAFGKLKKIALDGGVPVILCDAPNPGGGFWGPDDTIFATLDFSQGISRVPSAGGTPQHLTDSRRGNAEELLHLYPQLLPGGKAVLFEASNASGDSSLRVATLNDGKLKTLVEHSSHGRYLASGFLVFEQRESLFAAPMDAGRLELTGPPVPLVDSVSDFQNRAEFDVSASGTLVYLRGNPTYTVPAWLSPSGKIEPVLAEPGNFLAPHLSPDGTRMAIPAVRNGKQNLWVYDLKRESWNRLTSEDGPESLPTWTPDGEFIAFRSGNSLAWTRSDGSGKVERLEGVSRNAGPSSFSADGKWLAFWPLEPHSDLWVVPVSRTPGSLHMGQPQPLLQQPGTKGKPVISPDGRWLAYTSANAGPFEIYVIPFSPESRTTGRKWLVSNGGGVAPVWSRSGHELFYAGGDCRVQVASYTVKGEEFIAEKPRFFSDKPLADIGGFPGFDVSPDGKRVLGLVNSEERKAETVLHVLLNIDSELRRRAPGQSKSFPNN